MSADTDDTIRTTLGQLHHHLGTWARIDHNHEGFITRAGWAGLHYNVELTAPNLTDTTTITTQPTPPDPNNPNPWANHNHFTTTYPVTIHPHTCHHCGWPITYTATTTRYTQGGSGAHTTTTWAHLTGPSHTPGNPTNSTTCHTTGTPAQPEEHPTRNRSVGPAGASAGRRVVS